MIDPEPCRMRNKGGSECGTCSCHSPDDCINRGIPADSDRAVGLIKRALFPKKLRRAVFNGRERYARLVDHYRSTDA